MIEIQPLLCKVGHTDLISFEPSMSENTTRVSAALLVIGDEILSGRTQDKNIYFLANHLTAIGIDLSEVRVVPDIEARIVEAVNALRASYDYVFSTGGIGPTHDDITAQSLAKAFGVKLVEHEGALALMAKRYGVEGLTPARRLMARVPEGGVLVGDPETSSPGFMIENVFMLAGVPAIFRAMVHTLTPLLRTGPHVLSRAITAKCKESEIAALLSRHQDNSSGVSIGSYPYFRNGEYGVNVVLRGTDEDQLQIALDELATDLQKYGAEVINPAES